VFLASKAAWAGIVFLLLTSGISRPRGTLLASGTNLSKDVPTAMPTLVQPNDVRKIQEALQGNGQYGAKVDGVFGLRTRASIRGFQKAENLPVTGLLDTHTAGKLGVRPEGRVQTGYEATQGKPSAGIKWDARSRRTSRSLRNAVSRPNPTVPPA
jgi:peptidoglycan hydrolase-like protein with peptidoglycan-binding domain